MEKDYVCTECGHEYDELGDGKCYICGGDILPIDEFGEDTEKYPDDLIEEETEDIEEPNELWEEEEEEEEESDNANSL